MTVPTTAASSPPPSRPGDVEARLLIETMPAMLWRTSPTGAVEYVNRRLAEYFGQTQEEMCRRHVTEFLHPHDAEGPLQAWHDALRAGTSFATQVRLRRADGAYRWFEMRAEPLRDPEGRVVAWYGLQVDIHEARCIEEMLRMTQARLARAAQVATVSEAAASIAHEISQPLAAVVANAHACRRWLAAEPPNLERARRTVERLVRDGEGAADVVDRIRALFRRTESVREPLDLNDVIATLTRLMADEATSRGVRVRTELAEPLPTVSADRVQMQQVLLNLARNATEAMEPFEVERRVLTVRTRCSADDRVVVEIEDEGGGVRDPDRVFEPFYTTKEEGMGIGLAICRSIIEAHEGELQVENRTPHGATFRFSLPVAGASSP